MHSIVRVGKGKRFSRAVVYNQAATLSGLTADDRTGDIEAQTREALAKADLLLDELGTSRARILSAMIWLRDIMDFSRMNTVWEEWIDPDHPPARATVESRLAAPDVRVELQFTVAVPDGGGG